MVIELEYQEENKTPTLTYHLSIDEGKKGPEVVAEWLQQSALADKPPGRLLNFERGCGEAVRRHRSAMETRRETVNMTSPDLIAAHCLGQFDAYPRVAALRQFITDWYAPRLSADRMGSLRAVGSEARLSIGGENLANVIEYLQEKHPARLEEIIGALRRCIPRLEGVDAAALPGGRIGLQIKDETFEQPTLAAFASDGALMLLAFLSVLRSPEPPHFIGLEEPENFLHPRLLPGLVEEFRGASERAQLLLSSHSPYLLNAIHPNEARLLHRDAQGYTLATRVSAIEGITPLFENGAALGYLWMEGHLAIGDPLLERACRPSNPGANPRSEPGANQVRDGESAGEKKKPRRNRFK